MIIRRKRLVVNEILPMSSAFSLAVVRGPIVPIAEDVESWHFYLERFYKDPQRYAFLLQKSVEAHFHRTTQQLEMLKEEAKRTNRPICCVTERCPRDVLEIFLTANKDLLSAAEYVALTTSMEVYDALPIWKADAYINLACTPETSMRRIKERDSPGKSDIQFAYIQKLNKLYEDAYAQSDSLVIRTDFDVLWMNKALDVLAEPDE